MTAANLPEKQCTNHYHILHIHLTIHIPSCVPIIVTYSIFITRPTFHHGYQSLLCNPYSSHGPHFIMHTNQCHVLHMHCMARQEERKYYQQCVGVDQPSYSTTQRNQSALFFKFDAAIFPRQFLPCPYRAALAYT